MNSGRNEPCPCGSGKKYKKCCLGKQAGHVAPEEMRDLVENIRKKLECGEFASLAEAQSELESLMGQKNSTPVAEFHGLSPEQMYRFLHFPYESPELIQFVDVAPLCLDTPVIRLFRLLVEGLGEDGLKVTATGNLPPKFCRAAALGFWGEEGYAKFQPPFSIRTEIDFFQLHVLRIVAGCAGLIRKYKGKVLLTKKCRQKIADSGVGVMYRELFNAYVQKFNWGYLDGYTEVDFIQQSFLFTLYLLHKYGGETQLHTFYSEIFIQAFPQLLDEVPEASYLSPSDSVQNAYVHRSLNHFASFFGLITMQPATTDRLQRQYEVKKLPLLDQCISFTV